MHDSQKEGGKESRISGGKKSGFDKWVKIQAKTNIIKIINYRIINI